MERQDLIEILKHKKYTLEFIVSDLISLIKSYMLENNLTEFKLLQPIAIIGEDSRVFYTAYTIRLIYGTELYLKSNISGGDLMDSSTLNLTEKINLLTSVLYQLQSLKK